MKKAIASLLVISLTTSIFANDDLQVLADQTNDLYRVGAGAQDGSYTALSISILGWGVGLAVAIALLAATLNHSKKSTTSGSSSHAHCD